MCPYPRSRMPGMNFRIKLHRAQIVELHGPLVVVNAVVGQRQRPPDRAARVVDQDVDAAQVLEYLVGHGGDGVHVREVARVHVRDAAIGADVVGDLLQVFQRAGNQHHGAARLGDLVRDCLADAR
ncbi:hypothetical protein IWGMT90018_34070 [Mycobacterium kiyosense]|nr:hypothetical protein IWGMT90018_34070 [Mycobacterium kiyosense]